MMNLSISMVNALGNPDATLGMDVFAVIPDPLHVDGPSVLTADLRWAKLERAVLSRPGAVRLHRVRPADVLMVRRLLHAPAPLVLLLDAEYAADGWLLEGDGGSGEILPLARMAAGGGGPLLVIGTQPMAQPLAGLLENRMFGVLSLSTEPAERFSLAAHVLSELALGRTPQQLVDEGRVTFHGGEECVYIEPDPAGTGARTFDPLPPGAPAALRKPIGVDRQFSALLQALLPPAEDEVRTRGALVYGPAGSGKTVLSAAAVRRLAWHFTGGVITRRRGMPVLTTRDVIRQGAALFGVEAEARVVLHQLRRTPVAIIVDDCDRLEEAELQRLVEFLSELGSWCPTRTVLTATALPELVAGLDLHVVELGALLPEDERRDLARAFARDLAISDHGATVQATLRALSLFGSVPRAIELFVANNEGRKFAHRNLLLRLFPRMPDVLRRWIDRIEDKHGQLVEHLLARLDPVDVATLEALSVLPGPADFNAIAALRPEHVDSLPQSVERLLDRRFLDLDGHLLVLDRTLAGAVRQRLSAEALSVLEQRVQQHYLGFARTHASDLRKLEEQMANVRRALDLAQRSGDQPEGDIAATAASIARAMGENGRQEEAAALLRTAYDAAAPGQLLEFAWLNGDLATQRGEPDEAGSWFERAASHAQDSPARAQALLLAGRAYVAAGRPELARVALDEALSAASAPRQKADALLLRGMLELQAQQPAAAQDYFTETLGLADAATHTEQAEALRGLAAVARMDNRIGDAHDLLRQALEKWSALEETGAKVRTLQELGALLAESEPDTAREYVQSAERSAASIPLMERLR
jgi:tetratricopeptide (TPR) repeat protein